MIDWLTLHIDREKVSVEAWATLSARHGQIMKLSADGEIEWRCPARESIRSDSHQTTVLAGYDLQISGSPARVRNTNNVFGTGNPALAATQMILFVQEMTGVKLPLDLTQWRVTRMDVTENYDLGSPAEVRQALNYLRHAEGGRYQVRTSSESVYWNSGSRMRRGKAYHKGPHAAYQDKKGQAVYTPEQIEAAGRLLRLELSLCSEYWRRSTKPWHRVKDCELERMHSEYFGQFIGKCEVVEMDGLLNELEKVAPSEGQALAAYRTWSLIRAIGVRETEASMPRSTFLRHRKILFDAGLTHADLHASNVIPFRRRTIELGQPVRSWDELLKAA